MKIFEHKIVFLDNEAGTVQGSTYAGAEVNPLELLESVLDKFGDQGWELASVIAVPSTIQPDRLVASAWFKRGVVTAGADAPEPAPAP